MPHSSSARPSLPLALLIACSLALPVGAEERSSSPLELRDGDHVVFIGNTFADQLRLHGYLETLLTVRHPDKKLVFRDLGWSGDTLASRPRPLNFGSLDEHLTRQQADVVLACFGMNESFAGPEGIEAFRGDWEKLIRHLRSRTYNGESPPRVVMISPIAHEQLPPPLPDAEEHNQRLAAYTRVMRQVATRLNVPLVDLFTPLAELMRRPSTPQLTRNGIHLNETGYWVASRLIADALLPEASAWRVEVDAGQGEVVTTRGTRLKQIKTAGGALNLQLADARLPSPAAPKDAQQVLASADPSPVLVVKSLKPGTYQLTVDGQQVARANHRQWADGVTLENTPAQRRSDQLRQAIVDKNETFFHRWRAHNSEYIVGRRAKPFGVESFPPEMEAFDKLLTEKDGRIHQLARPADSQTWELTPVGDE